MSPPVDWIADALASLPPILTIAEAATVLRTSTRTLRRYIDGGRIRAVRQVEGGSSRVLVPRAEIERYLRSLQIAA